MKRSIQATLTGEAFKAKPVYGESSVGSGNQTLYCEFVDAFCRVSPRARAVAVLVSPATLTIMAAAAPSGRAL